MKARRLPASGASADAIGAGRPTLLPQQPLTPAELTHREYEGLQMIAAGLAEEDPRRFGWVRPLAELPQHNAIIMDYVGFPTMRRTLMTRSRLRPGRRGTHQLTGWTNAGGWLRRYHRLRPASPLLTRHATGPAVAALFEPYAEFMQRHAHHGSLVADLVRRAASRAAALLPASLPLVVGHGDFVVRNLFESPVGQVTAIDPLPRWLVPPYEDLARFVVGMRMLGLQVASHGAAFGPRQLDAFEAAFLSGYFGSDDVPWEQVRAYQLLVLLDKWSATVRPGSPRARPLEAGWRRWADASFRRELDRLVSAVAAPALPPGR